MKIRYSRKRVTIFHDIFHYLNDRNSSGAANVIRAIYAGIAFLAENPMASQETVLPEIRVKIVRRYNFKIFYRLDGDTIDVVYIRHAARRPLEG